MNTNHKERISRRRLLKTLAATGGAVAASTMLPGEWSKPLIEVGVLPAHAQVTPLATATATPGATTMVTPTGTVTTTPAPTDTSTPTPTETSTPTPTNTPTATPEPTIYALVCDSTPGGGDLTSLTNFCINEVAVIITLISGTGPVEGIDVTVTCSEPWITFNPASPPLTVATDATGRASFGNLCVQLGSGIVHGLEFDLIFSCTDPVNGGPLEAQCGTYRIFLNNP